MGITNLPPEPSGSLKSPKKTALQKLQEDLSRQIRPIQEIQKIQDQLWPLRQFEALQQQLKRCSPGQQLGDLMKPFGSDRLNHNRTRRHLNGVFGMAWQLL